MTWTTRQRWMLAAGLLVLVAAWAGPLPTWSGHAFWAHMLMHMAVVAVAAPLLAAGLAGSRFDPARRWPAVFAPVPASVLEFVVVWAWHAPVLHHAAAHGMAMRALEQGSFLAVGLLLWLSAFGGHRAHWRERAAAGIGGLLLTSMHMTLLGVLLALAGRSLYGHALADQQLGGVLMLAIGGTAYLAGALWLLAALLRDRDRVATHG